MSSDIEKSSMADAVPSLIADSNYPLTTHIFWELALSPINRVAAWFLTTFPVA